MQHFYLFSCIHYESIPIMCENMANASEHRTNSRIVDTRGRGYCVIVGNAVEFC